MKYCLPWLEIKFKKKLNLTTVDGTLGVFVALGVLTDVPQVWTLRFFWDPDC